MLLSKEQSFGQTRNQLLKPGVLLAITFVLLGSSSFLFAQTFGSSDRTDDTESAQQNNEEGLVHLKSGELAEASEHFQRAIKLQPKFADAYENLGATFNALNRPQEALDVLQRALLMRSNAETYCHLALAKRKLHQFSAAVEDYQQALALEPKLAEAYNGLGLAYRGLGRYDQATDAFERALQINPLYLHARNNLGVSRADTGNYPEAISILQRVIELDSSLASAHFNLAVVYLRLKRRNAALEQLKILRELDRELAGELEAGIYQGKILRIPAK